MKKSITMVEAARFLCSGGAYKRFLYKPNGQPRAASFIGISDIELDALMEPANDGDEEEVFSSYRKTLCMEILQSLAEEGELPGITALRPGDKVEYYFIDSREFLDFIGTLEVQQEDKADFLEWAEIQPAEKPVQAEEKPPHGNTQRNEAKRQAIIDAAEKIIAEDRQAFMRGGRLNATEIWRYMNDHSHRFFGGEPPLRDTAALPVLRKWLKTTK